MLLIGSTEIGGGFVRKAFSIGAERQPAGAPLTAEQIGALANRRALISKGFIAVYPKAGEASAPLTGQRYVVHTGGGRYDVIAGAKLNESALTKTEAEELAANPN
jgi:hypothetical protein